MEAPRERAVELEERLEEIRRRAGGLEGAAAGASAYAEVIHAAAELSEAHKQGLGLGGGVKGMPSLGVGGIQGVLSSGGNGLGVGGSSGGLSSERRRRS